MSIGKILVADRSISGYDVLLVPSITGTASPPEGIDTSNDALLHD